MPKTLLEHLFGTAKEDGVEDPETEFNTLFARDDTKVSTLEAEQIALKAENDRLRAAQEQHAATFARMEAENRETAAVNFANAQITAKRIVPASAEALKALAAAVSKSDATANFAEGEKSQTVLLQEFIDSLPDLSVFTTNMVKDAQFAILSGTEKTTGVGEPTAEERRAEADRILAATHAGRTALAERKNGTN